MKIQPRLNPISYENRDEYKRIIHAHVDYLVNNGFH
jgi:hypothetical protein